MASTYYTPSMLLEEGLQIWMSITTEYAGDTGCSFSFTWLHLHNFGPNIQEVHKNSIQWVPGALCLGIKHPRYETNHSPPPRTKINNLRTIPPIPLHAFMACIGMLLSTSTEILTDGRKYVYAKINTVKLSQTLSNLQNFNLWNYKKLKNCKNNISEMCTKFFTVGMKE
jgi:hypothetical protein